ncbi:MAG: hypothetical protein IJ189_01530 [Clostridia bacterium]|nr:hypothetical protein [Clostridia bacterium]
MKKSIFMRILAIALVAISIMAVAIPSMAETGMTVGQKAMVVCNSAGLKIRASASSEESLYWNVGSGTIVEILAVPNSSWYKVKVTKYVEGLHGTGWKGMIGYAKQEFLYAVYEA